MKTSQTPEQELHAALKRVVPWLGKMIADGGHLHSVAPNDAVGALQQAEAALANANKRAVIAATRDTIEASGAGRTPFAPEAKPTVWANTNGSLL